MADTVDDRSAAIMGARISVMWPPMVASGTAENGVSGCTVDWPAGQAPETGYSGIFRYLLTAGTHASDSHK